MIRKFTYSNLTVFFSILILLFIPHVIHAQTILFQDDFSDGNANGWEIKRNTCTSNWRVSNSRYGIIIPSACVTETIPSSLIIPEGINYTVDLDMTMSQNANMDRNFIFKYMNTQNWYGIHTFGNTVYVQKVVNGTVYFLPNWITHYAFQDNHTYHFRVEVTPTELKIYINGELNNTVTDQLPTFPNYSAGLQASGGGGVSNSEVWFDNIKICQLGDSTCDWIAPPQISVIKHVINDNGGTKQASDFTINATGTEPYPSSFAGSESGTIFTLSPGEYNVSEATQSGYLTTYGPDCSGTISAGESKTCTITNNDIAPPLVTKVFLVPGLGASWNPNAFANCTFDPNPDNWSLASYASDTYSPLITAVRIAGWNLKEFYYDWKAQIQNNSNVLSEVINSSNLGPNEKVNIVGHSMGGLVGINYTLDHPGTINGILTAGSPFQGSTLAYPAWEGGDIWNDNFITKIATTLLLKHCGSILGTNTDKETIHEVFPSIGDLLPTFDYLNNFKTHELINPAYALNSWSHSGFTVPDGPSLETLSGTGIDTLSGIAVKPVNKHEASLFLWQDGKPANKIYSTSGDGTVLTSSSQITGANNVMLNQSHSGLVASGEGICKILEFLGSPCPTFTAAFSEPNSALIIIGYPSNFSVTDQNGNSKKDKNGMVSFINPKSGLYKLNLLPTSNNTLLIVAQFLPNGEVKYKEYNLQGLGPKFKTLNFDLNHPSDDILN